MDNLAVNLFVQNNDRLLRQRSKTNSPVYKENSYGFPYGNIILNLFNNAEIPSGYYDSSAGNYQLDTLNNAHIEPNQFDGLGANLFNALSSISRYDDLKCVSRILCEMASGKPPGEYKRAPTGNNEEYLKGFGRNAFTQLLAGLTETSPILNFARAAVLGYSSNGNPTMCYRAFPRCPRNPDKLIHYLNNHNGGFFRFFSKRDRKSHLQSSYVSRDNPEFLGERQWKAPPPGIAGAETDRTGTGKLKFDNPVLTTRQDYEKKFFPRENTLESSGRVVFLDYEESSGRPLKNRISKSLSDLRDPDVTTFSRDSPLVFPQESEDQGVRILHFTSESSNSIPHNAFRFPH
ncbi:uncharacterized protein LOC105432973 isoform X2 [Pogonomyrmex barbatus]|nr:uncharacterized protein LOC105432973 isoform X2 [Pogonomyrmex barbatus]